MTEEKSTQQKVPQEQIVLSCEQCEFIESCQLSQQILELRQKLSFYLLKNQQLQIFLSQSEGKKLQVLQSYNPKQTIESQNDQQQVQTLEQQLLELENQLKKVQKLQSTQRLLQSQILQNIKDIENRQYQLIKEYKGLLQQESSLSFKEAKLNKMHSLFEKTNFISIIFSISFEDNRSFLNGELITPQNSWKIVQILAFYQQKYPKYHPIFKIDWNQMQIIPIENTKVDQFQQIGMINQEPIPIICDHVESILNTWIPLVLKQTQNLFMFLVKQSGKQTKIKYEINKESHFQHLRDRKFSNQLEKLNLILKCLLSNIDQINQLQFFAKQKRLKPS